ncbi:transposase, partial [Sulfolobus sp. E1]
FLHNARCGYVSRKAGIAQDVPPLWVGVIPLRGRVKAGDPLDSRDAQGLRVDIKLYEIR